MTPVLLFVNTKHIADEQRTLSNIVPIYQAIYSGLKAVGVTATLPEINRLVTVARKETAQSFDNSFKNKLSDKFAFIDEFVLDKLTTAAMPHVVNGIAYPYAKVKELFTLPDTSAIKQAFEPVWGNNAHLVFIYNAKDARVNLLTITNDVISPVPDADAQITALFTEYTKTDESAAVANDLQKICDSLNAFDKVYADEYKRGFFAQRLGSETPGYNTRGEGTQIAGIGWTNGLFIIDYKFIRQFERVGHLFFSWLK